MPIYARNSLGSNFQVTANENYSYADMGRILSECVQNDQTLFNAVLLNDFRENTAIREGTMVSSELTAFREFSVKEAWEGLKKKLQKLWEKIKGVFRQVYSKMTVWFVRYGKAFVAANRKILATKAGLDDCKIPKFIYLKKSPAETVDRLKAYADVVSGNWRGLSSNASDSDGYTEYFLGGVLKANGVTIDNFKDKFKEVHIEEMTDTTYKAIKAAGHSFEDLFSVITGKGKTIKALKDTEKKINDVIKKAMNEIDKAKKGDKEDKEANLYKDASARVSGLERAVTIITRTSIKAVRDEVGSARQVVGKLVAYSPTKESAVLEEMAWLEGADEFADVDSIPAEEINADDVQSDPDVEINIEVDDDGNECNK